MMQKRQSLVVVAAFCFAVASAFAQHPAHGGTGGGAGGSHGPAMSGGAAGHGNADSPEKGAASSSPTTLLDKNTKLDSKLTSKLQSKGLLPAGTDLKTECSGFKNLGQCIAAIHVSHNLDVPFACLRLSMTGTAAPAGTTCPAAASGSGKMSLGKSIQALAPKADSKTEEKSAKEQADADLKEAETNS